MLPRMGAISGLVIACACGPSGGDGTQGGSGSAGSSTSAGASVDADHDGGSHDVTGTSTGSTTTSSLDTSSDDELPADSPSFDVAVPPVAETCTASIEQQFDLEVSGPDGEVMVMHGWWGWEACCVRDPWIVLAAPAGIEVIEYAIQGAHLPIYVYGAASQRGPYIGPQEIAFAPIDGTLTQIEMGFELLEPLDPEAPTDGELPLLSASFDIDDGGWSAHGTVVLPHCDVLDTAPCPCE